MTDQAVDVFVGSADNGLVAAILRMIIVKGDRECKLIYNCIRRKFTW